MWTSRITRWSGRASVGVGTLWMFWTLAPWAGGVLLVSLLCALLGLLGLPLRQEGAIRAIAWAGYLVSVLSILTTIIGYGSVFFASNSSPFVFLIGFGNLCFGLLLTGIASLQGRALPRGNLIPIALGLLLALQIIWGWVYLWNDPTPTGATIAVWILLGLCFGSAWIALGLLLIATSRAATRPSLPYHR